MPQRRHPRQAPCGAKQDSTAPTDKGTFLAQLKALNNEGLIQKWAALNASAVSGWIPRSIAVGELYNRENLAGRALTPA